MNPIPKWVRIYWDAWDLRILVLSSFALQVILSIFGSRRKYISSLWISVLVWSAYLMADWVATVALGKLSDAEGKHGNNNELWAIWAPLLLLHLGGPDSITAYSLEDNQLWMRHLMGLVVQMFVAIYVILMSWTYSWFSFMSLPAFVAGVAKYGERTWVLKSVSDAKYIDTIPIYDIGHKYSPRGNEYVHVLVMAHKHLKEFAIFLENQPYVGYLRHSPYRDIEAQIAWDAVEVKMGLMYDLLYTKATKVFRKRGCILRFISLGCTVTVLVGLIIQIAHFNLREADDEIDIAITLVLILGAIALEIYAAIVTFSSDWMMLWLIKNGRRDWVIGLNKTFPWLFKKRKYWSNTMGQFDLLRYWLKHRETDAQSRSSSKKKCRKRIRLVLGRIIRLVFGRKYEEKWNRYLHKTEISVRPLVYNAISNHWKPDSNYRLFCSSYDKMDDELEKNWNILVQSDTFKGGVQAKIMGLHLATKILHQKEPDDNAGPFGSDFSCMENREVSKALSNYMMYLLIMNPSVLPNDGSSILEEHINNSTYLLGNTPNIDEAMACNSLLTKKTCSWYKIVRSLEAINEKPRRWEIMKLMWLRMLQTAAGDTIGFRQKDAHFQQLRQGGEFLTFFLVLLYPRAAKGRRPGNIHRVLTSM